MLGRLQAAWRELDGDQRRAGLAAVALLATLFLPWYQKNATVKTGLASKNLTAFGVFTFVEAAVFLVALGVFLLLFARGERRAFHLPGGDGTVIFGAGLWAALLLLWRVFDRPDVGSNANVGITWGFFFAFLAAAGLAAAGWRIRTQGRPEPPLLRADEGDADYGPRTSATEVVPRRRRPAASTRRAAEAEQLTLDDAAPPPPPADEPPRSAEPRPSAEPPRSTEPPRSAQPPPSAEQPREDPPPRPSTEPPPPSEPPRRTPERPLWAGPEPSDPAEEPTRRTEWSPDEPPRPRAERRADEEHEDPPPPPPLRPGVFDQDAE